MRSFVQLVAIVLQLSLGAVYLTSRIVTLYVNIKIVQYGELCDIDEDFGKCEPGLTPDDFH